VILGLAACGALPRPFQPGAKNRDNPLLKLPDTPGVVVAPVYDAPPALAAPLADLMAAALSARDIPATANRLLPQGHLLEGWFELVESEDGAVVDFIVNWRLGDPSGRLIGQTTVRRRMPEPGAEEALNSVLRDIVAEATPQLARSLVPERAPMKLPDKAALTIIEITGAPGDGNESLRDAVTTVLHQAGALVSVGAGKLPGIVEARLYCRVEVSAHSNRRDKVRIVWTIRDGRDREVAVLRQTNLVPRGRLSRGWGKLAFDATLAIRNDVVEAFRRIEEGGYGPLGLPPPK